MSARELLDAYADEQLYDLRGRKAGTPSAFAPLAIEALRAVLDLHSPGDRGAGATCSGCATDVTFTYWPCKTVHAIEEALKP